MDNYEEAKPTSTQPSKPLNTNIQHRGLGFLAPDALKKFFLDLFFPKFCLGCQREGAFLCQDCKATLDINEFDYCLCSKNPVRLTPGRNNGKCLRCQDKKLSGLYFALPYKEKTLTKKLIYQFKYEPYLKELAKPLAEILQDHFILSTRPGLVDVLSTRPGLVDALVPVPLHKDKLKSRGYNQSGELVKELSKILKIPVILDVLIKIKPTKPQMELKKEERETNLQNAFAINPVRKPEQLKSSDQLILSNGVKNPAVFAGKRIFLVDDVYTTGSTMQECARVLKEAGAKSVWGICIAREG